MTYAKARLKSSCDKTSPCFKPFWIGKLSEKCLSIRTSLYVPFKHILMGLTNFIRPPDSDPYHNLLPGMIAHQVHLNAFSCLSEYGQSDCGLRHMEKSKYIYACCRVGTLYFYNEIFRYGKIYYSNSIIIINLCKLSFPVVGLKMSSLRTLALKSYNKIFIWHLKYLVRIFIYLSDIILCSHRVQVGRQHGVPILQIENKSV
jgi:hypothetical protein